MAPNDRERAETLDHYWDAIVRGETPTRTDGIDDIAAAVIARLGESAVSPYLGAAQQRVRQQIVESTAATHTAVPRQDIHPPLPAPKHREGTSRLNLPGAPRAALILAATILLAVSVALAIRMLDLGRDDNRHTTGPAIPAPATPSPEATPEGALFEITLPADLVPHTDARFFGIQYVSIPPGVDSHWVPYWGTGPYGEYVMSGSYRERIEADVQVLRAVGTLEDVPANTELTLSAGDTLISLNENKAETINDGAESAEVITWLFMDDPDDKFGGRNEDGWIGNNFSVKGDGAQELPALPGAAVLRLQRLELASEEKVFAPAGGVQLALALGPVSESIIKAGDGSYFMASNIYGDPTTIVYVLTLMPAGPPGTAQPPTSSA